MVHGSWFKIMMDSSLEERLQSFIDSEGKSCSFDPELITPEYVYRMWGGSVAIDEIATRRRRWSRIRMTDSLCLNRLPVSL